MSDFEDDDNAVCPLCVEEMDLSDRNFLPCPCGYRVCMWCWHHIRENLNGLCPACRTPYNSDPHAFSAVDRQEVVKKNRERKQREKQDKKVTDKPVSSKTTATIDRKHLHNYRVVQRNLVYVIGLPLSIATEDILRKAEYFGQYGKISKMVVHRNQTVSQSSASAYVTFAFKEDAKAAIHALDNYVLDGHTLRASFGTTKYCNNFIRNMPCNNPDCVYLHDLGEEDDRFSKEEIQAGHSKLMPTPGKDQSLIVGCGGPSGTGKRPNGEPILPAPVFIQDNPAASVSAKPPLLSRASSLNPPPEQKEATDSNANAAKSSEKFIPAKNSENLNAPKKSIVEKVERGPAQVPATNEQASRASTAPSVKEQPQKETAKNEAVQYVVISPSDNNNSFNGVTWNAVFPVPTSSLSSPLWSAILRVSHSNLLVNPFGQSRLSVAEILDLTLPPIDAAAMAPWPRSQGYYVSSLVTDHRAEGAMAPGVIADVGQTQNSLTALKQVFPAVKLSQGSNPSYGIPAPVANR